MVEGCKPLGPWGCEREVNVKMKMMKEKADECGKFITLSFTNSF